MDISLFDRESLKQRVIEINEKIKLVNEQKQFQKKIFYENELKQTLDAIESLKKVKNYKDYKQYLNVYDSKTSINIDEATFANGKIIKYYQKNSILEKIMRIRLNH